VQIGVGILGVAFLAGVLFAAPYQDRRNWFPIEEFSRQGPLKVRLSFVLGEIEIVPGDTVRITGEAWGHGVPTSAIAEQFVEIEREKDTVIVYRERLSGWFSEIEESVTVEVPWSRVRFLDIETGQAHVAVDWRDGKEKSRLRISGGEGSVAIRAGEGAVSVRGAGRERVADERGAAARSAPRKHPDARRIEVTKEFRGEIRLLP